MAGNYLAKNWTIGFSGYWHYNAENKGKNINQTLFTTNTPTVTMPSITSSNFQRSNKKIEFTYPGITNSYSGWSNKVALYKQDDTNKSGSAAYGTYSFTDNTGDLNYGTQYTYTVCYCPKGWTLNSESDAEGLSDFARYTLSRDFAFSDSQPV